MSKYRLLPTARDTLVDIYDYTTKTWGETQADIYLDGIYDFFGRLTENKALWRRVSFDYEIDGFFAIYKKHYVYWYVMKNGKIAIVAILHERMHQFRRLSDAFREIDNDS